MAVLGGVTDMDAVSVMVSNNQRITVAIPKL